MPATNRPGLLGLFLALLIAPTAPADDGPPTLEAGLLAQPAAELAREAAGSGDARRGAYVFHRPALLCAKCHDEGGAGLGPDLARWPEPPTVEAIVDAVLRPSDSIREGYEPIAVATRDGRVVSGVLAGRGDEGLVLRLADPIGEALRIPLDQVEEERPGAASVMPAGLVNALATRQEFLDLVRYLAEIAEGGPDRARALAPPPSALAPPKLAAYEADLDHAGLIRALDDRSLERGRAIYERLCINCHGTPDRPGSLPSSRRFASEPLKNGSDPYSMYRTLTHGFGQMEAQALLVPRQKYDVIHYVREAYLRPRDPAQYRPVTEDYLASLPAGHTRGPVPSAIEPWQAMDYGPYLIATYEIGTDGANFAHKGIAVRLDPGPGGVAAGRTWAVFDHDTMRLAAVWDGRGFIDWRGILFDGEHAVHPRVVGDVLVQNPTGPGWADPSTGSFADDRRVEGRDGRRYGPLPADWSAYRGLHRVGSRVILSYDVGSTPVLETCSLAESESPGPVVVRTLDVGPRDGERTIQVARVAPGEAMHRLSPGANALGGDRPLVVGLMPEDTPATWTLEPSGDLRLSLPAGRERLRFSVWFARAKDPDEAGATAGSVSLPEPAPDLAALAAQPGPSLWPSPVETRATIGDDSGPFAVDVLTTPQANPWQCRVRPTGFDFLDGGKAAAVCTWDGDVWIVSGLDRPGGPLAWRRFASGLFQPLGLKVIDGAIYVTCRDQIAVLEDRDGDGEAEFVRCFNNDQQVTEHFHEFAMGLQVDGAGNLYYTKAARHALEAVVPQHGTLLRVSPDGRRTDILATGFRAPNGVCLNPDGTFFVTDQEGHWIPKNRINWIRPGRFYGNMWGYTDVTNPSDFAMEPPVCWITNRFERSPAEPLWVTSDAWGALKGSLLNFSYGYGKIHLVLREPIDDGAQLQGGLVELPIPQFPTGLIRGRFGPLDGQLYTCGMFAWAGNQQDPGDFYRVRATGKPSDVPLALNALADGVRLTFSDPIDPASVAPERFAVTVWDIHRTGNYGSDHFNERPLPVAGASLADDGRTLTLKLPGLAPTRGMEIRYDLRAADGRPVAGTIHNTIHRLPSP
jgi:putative heme-binding domain-containing protein